MKIVFFGTSEFGSIVLEKLVQAGLSPVLVVTTPDKPVGRKQLLTPPPVKILAKTYGLEIFQPANLLNSAIAELTRQKVDMFIVASYGKILPKAVLDIPKLGTLNVHPSLLPKYRGPSPIQATLLNGDKETGVSIIVLDEKMDHGPVVAVERFGIQNKKYTYLKLHNALAELGGDLLIRTIPLWTEGKIRAQAQDESQATYTSIIQKEDGRIDWGKSAKYIERQIRAFTPWPGTFTLFEGKNLKILKASVLSVNLARLSFTKLSEAKFPPGAVFLTADKKLAIQCGEDALVVEELQLEGKKPMSSKEFLLGHKNIIGTILC